MIENDDGFLSEYVSCDLCPRGCGVDRTSGGVGYCRESFELHVARASLHMWEEPCISGKSGSGTVFFSGCNMGCVFCQNRAISRGETGKKISPDRLVDIFFELEDKGANNINLVTGDMFIPTVRVAIERARAKGIGIPFLMNTSSYVSVEALKSLEGLIDIYLPDFKYFSSEIAGAFSDAPDYPDVVKAAINEMVRQTGKPVFDEEGMLKRGTVVRHLILPGHYRDSIEIMKWLAGNHREDILISVMRQFTPNKRTDIKELNRILTTYEYEAVLNVLIELGMENVYIQEKGSEGKDFIPAFDLTGVD